MIYGPVHSDAPASVRGAPNDANRSELFSTIAPQADGLAWPAPTAKMPLFGPLAPEDDGTLDARGMADDNPGIIAARVPTAGTVQQLPPRTVSAGSETVRNVARFDWPNARNGWAYRLIRGGLRTTMLAPELQSELDDTGKANVMPARGMTPPYVVVPPQPWYDSFTRTIGR